MRTWAEIRFESLAANLTALERRMPAGARLLLLVKANAYGHGAVAITRWAEELGVEWLGVATPGEAFELRAAGSRSRVLLLGPLPHEGLDHLRRASVTPTLCSLEDASRWARSAPGVPAHVEIDTGMGRAGFDWRRTSELARLAGTPGLALEAAYTHFPAAESDPAFTLEQHDRFRRLIRELADGGLRFPMVHLSNSAALLRHPSFAADLVRPGIAAYGAAGAAGAPPEAASELEPVLRWWAPVVQLREFHPGDTVGYGRTAVIQRRTRAALLAVGYGDGYPCSQANAGWVELGGAPCPVLGRVSMDLTMVELSAAATVAVGDAALLMGDAAGLTADDLGARSGTHAYEILTGIRGRVERRYVRVGGKAGDASAAKVNERPAAEQTEPSATELLEEAELLQAAERARSNAYAPYSGYAVGAALEAASGRTYLGANVENAAYGITTCAERVALFKAISDGERHFRRIAVVCHGTAPFPCGACRQALAEFSPGIDVLVRGGGGLHRRRLTDLLPDAFGGSTPARP